MFKLKCVFNIILLVSVILLTPVNAFSAQLVDINRADAATMIENWKGIGEKKARAIVSYRKNNGPFTSIEDLTNVKGIGEGIIKNNRKYMSVSKGVSKPTKKTQSTNKTTNSNNSKKAANTKKKSTATTSTSKKSASTKSTSKASTDKKSTKKKSTSKKSTSTTSKKKKCKSGSKDKGCVAKKSKKKKSTT